MDPDRLHQRFAIAGRAVSPDHCRAIANLLDRYNITLTVHSFSPNGLVVEDASGRTVGDYEITKKIEPYSQVLIVTDGGHVLGWALAEDVQEGQLPVNNILPLPETFDFARPCPHLSTFGGIWNGKSWECLGCGKSVAVV